MPTMETPQLNAGDKTGIGTPSVLGGAESIDAHALAAELNHFGGEAVVTRAVYFPSGSHANNAADSAGYRKNRENRIKQFATQFEQQLAA